MLFFLGTSLTLEYNVQNKGHPLAMSFWIVRQRLLLGKLDIDFNGLRYSFLKIIWITGAVHDNESNSKNDQLEECSRHLS